MYGVFFNNCAFYINMHSYHVNMLCLYLSLQIKKKLTWICKIFVFENEVLMGVRLFQPLERKDIFSLSQIMFRNGMMEQNGHHILHFKVHISFPKCLDIVFLFL